MIPASMRTDYSGYQKDLTSQALSRLLLQFQDSPILAALISAYMVEVQRLYDALIDLMDLRTLYQAQGYNLDALLRIIGVTRDIVIYDSSMWFEFDQLGQGFDLGLAWVTNALMGTAGLADDGQAKTLALAKIARNFCKFGSVPEIINFVKLYSGINVSINITGPMEAVAMIPAGSPQSLIDLLTVSKTTGQVDELYAPPYPATLNITAVPIMNIVQEDGQDILTEDGQQISLEDVR